MDNDTIGRFGYISAYDPERHFARVEFPDLGIVSGWLPVAVHNSKDNHDEKHFDIGEHVYCLLHDNTGIILCAVYDNSNTPPVASTDTRAITFKDGTVITYDRAEHITDITDCNGNNIHMDSKGITITSCGYIHVNASANYECKASANMIFSASRIDLN